MYRLLTVYLVIFCVVNLFILVPAISAAQISGFVYYSDEETAVKNAIVTLTDDTGDKHDSSPTDDAGNYLIDSVMPGEYEVSVRVRSFKRGFTIDDDTIAAEFYVQGRLIVEEDALVDLILILNTTPFGLFIVSPIGIALIGGITGGLIYAGIKIFEDDEPASPYMP